MRRCPSWAADVCDIRRAADYVFITCTERFVFKERTPPPANVNINCGFEDKSAQLSVAIKATAGKKNSLLTFLKQREEEEEERRQTVWLEAAPTVPSRCLAWLSPFKDSRM